MVRAMSAPPQALPRTWKIVTLWLVLGSALFLGVQAWLAERQRPRVQVDPQGGIALQRGPDRHFHWPGRIGGQAVDFLVDTGATRTALPESLARELGLPRLAETQSDTAGGRVRGWLSQVDLTLQGGVRLERLPVVVLPALDSPLLGMDVLGRLHFSQRDGVLRIEPER